MKKSVIAAGVIVALGVVWTGAAWYTGKQLESHLAEMVAQANSELKRTAPEAGLEVSYQDYQRGLFKSHLQPYPFHGLGKIYTGEQRSVKTAVRSGEE